MHLQMYASASLLAMTPTATAHSRTQKERREATRQLLLDTTLECLAQCGYAHTTTQLICERSGLTRGAPQHYFSTHEGLLAEAIDHLRQRLTSTYEAVIASMPEGPCHAQEALDVLWDLYTGELFRCALELWVGARTNPALAEQLAPGRARPRPNHDAHVPGPLSRARSGRGVRPGHRSDPVVDPRLGAARDRSAIRHGQRPMAPDAHRATSRY